MNELSTSAGHPPPNVQLLLVARADSGHSIANDHYLQDGFVCSAYGSGSWVARERSQSTDVVANTHAAGDATCGWVVSGCRVAVRITWKLRHDHTYDAIVVPVASVQEFVFIGDIQEAIRKLHDPVLLVPIWLGRCSTRSLSGKVKIQQHKPEPLGRRSPAKCGPVSPE